MKTKIFPDLPRQTGALLGLALAALPVPAQAASDDGSVLFNQTCAHCHGGNGQGGTLGPSILQRVAGESDESLSAYLRVGNPPRGMPPAVVDDAGMTALLAYLRVLSSTVADAEFSTEDTRNQYASTPSIENFEPVTEEMLLNPDPADWLMFSRTYDAQRFSPLDQINRGNVGELALAWSRGLPDGVTETIPTVYDGVMYLTYPDATVAALDAATGDLIWHHAPEFENGGGASERSKTMSIFADMVYFAAHDGSVIAIDAQSGEQRWRSEPSNRNLTAGTIVVEGKVMAAGTCRVREDCYVSAHDARSGELAWKFFTTQAPDEPPGFDTWAGLPLSSRQASAWGLPGSYDAEAGLLYWSIANPTPYTRYERHNGDPGAISYSAPANLYSNSTVALNPQTGALAWYYQHLPGDDWDEDMDQERVILRTRLAPDPEHVRWINPAIAPGEVRDVIVNVGEGGGLWVLDKFSGEFLWAMPFPEDVENFILEDIDVATGATVINRDLVLDRPGAHRIICYFNTRSYWPTSYHPGRNALYVPYINNCLNMTAASPATETMPAMPQSRIGFPRPGVPAAELNGLARVDMETGEITHWPMGPIPTNSSILTTAGDLIFWGDINRRYRAMDADRGAILWETILSGPISTSNITYAVDGRQYVAVIAGFNLSQGGLNTGASGPIKLNIDTGAQNAIFVFALPR